MLWSDSATLPKMLRNLKVDVFVIGYKWFRVKSVLGSKCPRVQTVMGSKWLWVKNNQGINVPGYTKPFSILINLTCIFINMGAMKNKPIILLLLVNRRLSPSISTLK